MKSGIFPSALKFGFITPIYKSGDTSDVRNYRTIIIQSCLAKVFESVVLSKLSHACKNFIIPQQHVFFSGRSTNTNLAVYQHRIISEFQNGHQLDSAYLDFSQAFDQGSHYHLFQKLEDLGIGGQMLGWFRSYLVCHKLMVRFGGPVSSEIPLHK